MASNFTYSRSLRAIGQALELMDIDLFELFTQEEKVYLQCGEPTPPHLGIVDLQYSLNELRSFDLEGQAKRESAFKFVDFTGLSEILRAVGGHVDCQRGRLRRICNCESIREQPSITVEYETSDGHVYVDELVVAKLADLAMKMYKDRSRIIQDHAHK
jgi:hypothetical protein